jgi:hypothetical protein
LITRRPSQQKLKLERVDEPSYAPVSGSHCAGTTGEITQTGFCGVLDVDSDSVRLVGHMIGYIVVRPDKSQHQRQSSNPSAFAPSSRCSVATGFTYATVFNELVIGKCF